MERDALIAHGTSFLLQDRLMNCSDYSTAWVCRKCGSIISLGYDDISFGTKTKPKFSLMGGGEYCRLCRVEPSNSIRQSEAKEKEASLTKHLVALTYAEQNVLLRHRDGGDLDVIAVPFVFRYLCAELASMGIAITLEVR